MSEPIEHPDSGRTIQRDQHQGKFAPTPDAQEGTNGMTKPSWRNRNHRGGKPDPAPADTLLTPAVDAESARTPRQPGKGDDAAMNQHLPQQQQQALPSGDLIKGKWKQQMGAAKIAWGKLTEDELLRLEGHEQKLSGLVQERYAVTRDEADRQVREFFEKNQG